MPAFFFGVGLLLAGCHTPSQSVDSVAIEGRPAHHTENGFRNPYPVDDLRRSFFSYWYMRLFKEDFPDYELVAHEMPRRSLGPEVLRGSAKLPRVTWIGHATFLVQYRKINILTDPHFSERASPFSFAGPKRLVPLPIQLDELPNIDYVLISHNHYDQLDETTVRTLGNGPEWLVPLKLKATLVKWGIDPERVTEFDWWQKKAEQGIDITATPAHHWTARGLFDRNETLWSSWMVEMNGFSFWFAGDTAYNEVQFKEIGRRFSRVDLALIPIGGYAPRWFMQDAHVNPEEAVRIHLELGSRQSFGMHWGTFQLTAEPMLEPPARLARAIKTAGQGVPPFESLAIGEVRILPLSGARE